MKTATLISIFGLLANSLLANVIPSPLFRDGAILQQGKPVPVWGRADPGEKISVTFKDQKKETAADAQGHWKIELNPLSASDEPAELIISGNNTLRIADVLVGEVWICSGQSNMEWPVSQAQNYSEESAAATHPTIRQFKVPRKASETAQDDLNGSWVACSPASVGNFTAAGYFFARELSENLKVPVGIINTSFGGTPVESWMSQSALQSNSDFSIVASRWEKTLQDYPNLMKVYEENLAKWNADRKAAANASQPFKTPQPRKPPGSGSQMMPSSLFNAMVHPLIPYAVQGIIWYQGEANAARFTEYAELFKALITQWRGDLGQGDIPFYFVQLANLERGNDSRAEWAFLREAQAEAFDLPNTGMAVAADIGDPRNIHPANKQEVGRRLALIALAEAYGKNESGSAPRFSKAETDGSSVKIFFLPERTLELRNDTGFLVAGADQIFHPATASLSGNTLIVSSPSVSNPVAVRYAWANNPTMGLYDETGLPVPPFRSDDWPAPDAAPRLP